MAVLSDCMTYYMRDLRPRMEFLNTTPPWERDVAGGGNYNWATTQFKAGLHKTADPGEANGIATNKADYTGYADITYARGTGTWEIISSGTANPYARTKGAMYWPENTGASQTVIACSIAMISAGTDYSMARDASFSLAIPTNRVPFIAANGLTIKAR